MRTYLVRRLLLVIPSVLILSFIIFFLVRLIPGDIIDLMIGQMSYYNVITDRSGLERALGMDVPLLTQYGRWLGVLPGADGSIRGVLQGNLGKSLWRGTPITELVAARWPVTLELGLLALIVAQLIALPIGVFSALRQDTWGDYIARSFAVFCIAIPGFWLGTMIIVFSSIWWGYMAPIKVIPLTGNPIGNLRMFIVPAVVLGMEMSGTTMRMTRTMMLEVQRQDYIRTAWAKGLKEIVVVERHALKNALIPVVTIVGMQIPLVVGGTVIIEQIFNLPGMGRLLVQATLDRDYTIVSAVTLLFGTAVVFINLLVDLAYGFLDPRIRTK